MPDAAIQLRAWVTEDLPFLWEMLFLAIHLRHPEMSLSVDDDNTGATALYRSLGFVVVDAAGGSTTMLRRATHGSIRHAPDLSQRRVLTTRFAAAVTCHGGGGGGGGVRGRWPLAALLTVTVAAAGRRVDRGRRRVQGVVGGVGVSGQWLGRVVWCRFRGRAPSRRGS